MGMQHITKYIHFKFFTLCPVCTCHIYIAAGTNKYSNFRCLEPIKILCPLSCLRFKRRLQYYLVFSLPGMAYTVINYSAVLCINIPYKPVTRKIKKDM